jgi:hypothetical protein
MGIHSATCAERLIFIQILDMKNCLPLLLLVMICWGCKDEKPDLSGETPLKISDFIAVFPKIKPPYSVSDTNITKVGDTTTIGYKALIQFFPDSSLTPIVGANKKLTIHPIGIIEKDKENYLLVSLRSPKKITHIAVFVLDKKNKYLASKELLSTNHEDEYLHSVLINREPTFLISKEKMGADNTMRFTRAGWVYTSSGEFMVVINDSNEDPKKATVINPIDTLPRKNKFSGDYVQNKKNFISIRDTKKPNVYEFFIHFEKNEGSCKGELKGEFTMKNGNSAIFSENGDPCIIDFHFNGSEVYVKEKGSCGNHRGIKCFFDDSFIKKREPRSKKK